MKACLPRRSWRILRIQNWRETCAAPLFEHYIGGGAIETRKSAKWTHSVPGLAGCIGRDGLDGLDGRKAGGVRGVTPSSTRELLRRPDDRQRIDYPSRRLHRPFVGLVRRDHHRHELPRIVLALVDRREADPRIP